MANFPSREKIRGRLTCVTLVFSGVMVAVAGMIAVDLITVANLEAQDVWLAAIPSGILGALAVYLALRAETAHGAVSATVAWCAVFAILNTPYVYFVAHVEKFVDPATWAILVLASIVGAFVALPLGLLFGAVLAPPVSWARLLMLRPAVDGPERATVWFSVAGVVSGFALFGVTLCWDGGTVPPLLPAALVFASAAAGVVAAIRLHRHARWSERVCNGTEPGWVLIHPRGRSDYGDTLPYLQAAASEASSEGEGEGEVSSWLAETVRSDTGAYRETALPRALVYTRLA